MQNDVRLENPTGLGSRGPCISYVSYSATQLPRWRERESDQNQFGIAKGDGRMGEWGRGHLEINRQQLAFLLVPMIVSLEPFQNVCLSQISVQEA